MKDIMCIRVQNWLRQIDRAENLADPLFASLCEHVARCDTCQGAILVLLAESGQPASPLCETSCQDCQDDLAAYVDIEREDGIRAAMREYPHVWWHLLFCPTCFETYQMMTLLLDAEQSGKLAALSSLQKAEVEVAQTIQPPLWPTTRPRTRLHISRRMLRRALAVQPMLGMMHGADSEDTVLLDDTSSGSMITLSVLKQVDASWNILVTVTPPIAGKVVVAFDATLFRATFSTAGQAVILNVPANLLMAAEGPDMDISLEPDETEDAAG